jgi:hypothetical protein
MDDSILKRWSGLTLGILGPAFLAIPIAQAEPVTITGILDNRFSDNALREPTNEQSDLETRLGVSFRHVTDPGRCNSSLDGRVGYSHWLDSSFDSRLYADAGFQGNCELTHGLDWALSDRLSDVRQDSRRPDVPDNTTRKNVFSTGPRYTLFLTQRDQLQFSLQYQNTEFEEPEQNDSDRVIGSAAWNHLFSSTLSAGVSASSNQAELDTGVEIDRNTASITFANSWPTTDLSGSLGVSEIETTSGSGSQTSDGLVGDLSINRQINPSADFFFTVSRELTDQTSDFDFQFGDFEFNLTETEAVEVTALSTGIAKLFSDGSTVRASISASRTRYLTSEINEDRIGLNVLGNRPLNSRVSMTSSLRLDHLNYEEDESEDSIITFDVGVLYTLSRDLSLNARLGHERRSSDVPSREYQENWILVGLSYRFL